MDLEKVDWKEMERMTLEKLQGKLEASDWKWLQKNVRWTALDLDLATTPEVLEAFGKREKPSQVNSAMVLRTLIWQSWIKIRAKAQEAVHGNVRSFWYQVVEPFYRKHGLLERRKRSPEDRVIQDMTKFVGEFIRHHIFRYGGEFKFEAPIDHLYRVGRDRPRIMFATEKEGLWWLCHELYKSDDTSVTALASNGQPSFVALEYFSLDLKDRTKSLDIGVFSDLDPWGYGIAEQIDAKMRFLGFEVNTYMLTSVGLFTPQQIAHGRDLTKVKPGQVKLVREWMRKTGGVNGKPIGLHIDVIPAPKKELLARAFVKAACDRKLDQHYKLVQPLDLDSLEPKSFC